MANAQKNVETFVDKLSSLRFAATIITVFWALVPGYLTVLYFKPELFVALDPIKLTILAGMFAAVFIAPVSYLLMWDFSKDGLDEQTLRELRKIKSQVIESPKKIPRGDDLVADIENAERFSRENGFIEGIVIAAGYGLFNSSLQIAYQYFTHMHSPRFFLVMMVAGTILFSGLAILRNRATRIFG